MTSKLPASRRYMGEANMLAPLYTRILELDGWRALAAAGGAGAFANLAFAPLYIWPALLVSVIFLLWLMDGASVTENPKAAAFWRGGAFAFGLFGVGFHWLGFAFLVTPNAHLAFIWLVPALIAVLSFIWALALRIMIRFWSNGPQRVVLFATTLIAAEWTRGHLFGGFPWNLPGMIWAPGGAVSQLASIGGIWTLSAITLAAFAAPAALADLRPRASVFSRVAPGLVAAMAFGATWGWGAQRLQSAPDAGAANGPTIRIVDAGVPQAEKHKPEQRANVLRRYLELTGADGPNTPGIVIWPEGAVPYALLQWPDALDPVSERLGVRRLIVGTSRVDRLSAGRERWYNSVAVISGDSNRRGALSIYDKHRLVPFGEFVPFRDVAARIGVETLQTLATSGFYPGPPPSRQSAPGIPAFGPLVCYEALFPGLS
ncbi:MAG: apolipoprotein N-acyltransferase, partial [Pseudomonadota bacterium]